MIALQGVIALRGAIEVDVVPLGARLAAVRTPDRDGQLGDVLLGLDDYASDRAYLGATVGRYANRIAGGRFTLDGRAHEVPCNEPGAALHGGPGGFDAHVWDVADTGPAHAVFRRTSPDGENGFPGALDVEVVYRLDGAALEIAYTATTDAPTVLNLTNHAYWNLAGGGTVEHHVLRVRAGRYLPVDEHLIPTGDLADVTGTPFDLRTPTPIGARLRESHPQLVAGRGYDHTFVLDPGDGPAVHLDAPASGRWLEVSTDRPGVQVYSGGMLDGTLVLRGDVVARQGDAVCLETQAFPDAPNRPEFPSTVLRPGEVHRTRTVLRFGAD